MSLIPLIAAGNTDEVLKMLSKKKSLGSKVEDDGTTPLHAALEHGNTTLAVTLLKSYKANVLARDAAGRTPLLIASMKGNFEFLEQAFAKRLVVPVDEHNNTLLHTLARYTVGGIINMELFYRVASAVIASGVDINALNNEGETALHLAAYHGNEPFVLFIVNQKGLDFNIQTREGLTAIQMAARESHKSVVCLRRTICEPLHATH
jgi:uncharacterized protein